MVEAFENLRELTFQCKAAYDAESYELTRDKWRFPVSSSLLSAILNRHSLRKITFWGLDFTGVGPIHPPNSEEASGHNGNLETIRFHSCHASEIQILGPAFPNLQHLCLSSTLYADCTWPSFGVSKDGEGWKRLTSLTLSGCAARGDLEMMYATIR